MNSSAIPSRFDISEFPHRWVPVNGFDVFFGCGFIRKPGKRLDFEGVYPRYAAIYVLRGKGTYTDAAGREYPLAPGSLFQRFENSWHRHTIDPDSDWLEFFIAYHIRPHGGDAHPTQLLQALGVVNAAQPVFHVPPDVPFLDQCLELTHELQTASGIGLRPLPAKGTALLSQLFLRAEQKDGAGGGDDMIGRVCALIRGNLDRRTPLTELLQEIPVSYSWLRALFHKRMGVSMARYEVQCRIDRALTLLATGKSVKEVASMLGYKDPFAFSAQFKKGTGFSPSRHPGL